MFPHQCQIGGRDSPAAKTIEHVSQEFHPPKEGRAGLCCKHKQLSSHANCGLACSSRGPRLELAPDWGVLRTADALRFAHALTRARTNSGMTRPRPRRWRGWSRSAVDAVAQCRLRAVRHGHCVRSRHDHAAATRRGAPARAVRRAGTLSGVGSARGVPLVPVAEGCRF